MALNALLKTKERHSHRLWILNWLEDNYECKQGNTICKAAVFSDYAEVCRIQKLKPVTNSLFGKLVKAVFPSIRTCRKGPRSDSRTHYAGLNRRRSTISLPQICPETGEPLATPQMVSYIPASTSSGVSDSVGQVHSDYSLTSSTPSSPSLSYETSPIVASVVEASGTLPTNLGMRSESQTLRYLPLADNQPQLPYHFSSHHQSLSSCSSGASTYDEALSEFEEMDLGEVSSSLIDSLNSSCGCEHDSSFPMPMLPACQCPSCDHESNSLDAVEDVLGDLEPRILNFDSSILSQLAKSEPGASFSALSSECGYGQHVPHVPMSASMMNPPVAPSPPASPPPPLSLMGSSDFSGSLAGGCKIRPAFLRRTMAMAAAKTTAHAADGNPLAEGLMGVINTCQKMINQKRRRRSSVDVKQEHQQQGIYHPQAKKQYTMPTSTVDANALVPPFVLNLDEIPGSTSNFALQESVLIFANEYRKMYQSVFDRLVKFEYAILFDFMFSFWSQVKLQPNFSSLLDLEPVKKQILAYDKKVLHTFQDYFMLNSLKMSGQQFGGYLQTVAFHLPFAHERATSSLLPVDLREEKLRIFQSFAADLQLRAQSFIAVGPSAHISAPASTIMEINNY